MRGSCRLEVMHHVNLCVHRQDGRTPLLVAAFKSHTEIATMLVEKGADINQAMNVSFP